MGKGVQLSLSHTTAPLDSWCWETVLTPVEGHLEAPWHFAGWVMGPPTAGQGRCQPGGTVPLLAVLPSVWTKGQPVRSQVSECPSQGS